MDVILNKVLTSPHLTSPHQQRLPQPHLTRPTHSASSNPTLASSPRPRRPRPHHALPFFLVWQVLKQHDEHLEREAASAALLAADADTTSAPVAEKAGLLGKGGRTVSPSQEERK